MTDIAVYSCASGNGDAVSSIHAVLSYPAGRLWRVYAVTTGLCFDKVTRKIIQVRNHGRQEQNAGTETQTRCALRHLSNQFRKRCIPTTTFLFSLLSPPVLRCDWSDLRLGLATTKWWTSACMDYTKLLPITMCHLLEVKKTI